MLKQQHILHVVIGPGSLYEHCFGSLNGREIFFYKSKACETSLSEKTRKYDSPPFPIRGSINRDFIVYVQTTSPLSPTAGETGVSHFYTALLYICASYLSRRPNAVGVFFFLFSPFRH